MLLRVYKLKAGVREDSKHLLPTTDLLDAGLFKQLGENEHTRGSSGVRDQLASGGPFRRLGHQQKGLKLCREVCTEFHVDLSEPKVVFEKRAWWSSERLAVRVSAPAWLIVWCCLIRKLRHFHFYPFSCFSVSAGSPLRARHRLR